VKRINYSHDAVADLIIGNPGMTIKEIAQVIGYTQSWISRVISSDAFQQRLAQRKLEIVDPRLMASVEDRLRGLATLSVDVIEQKLEATGSPDLAIKALEISSKALGFGARQPAPTSQVQNNFVVQLPAKAPTTEDWLAQQAKKVE
jgi:hypothetical protein